MLRFLLLLSCCAVLACGGASSNAPPAAEAPTPSSPAVAQAEPHPPHASVEVPAAIQAIVDAPDRSEADRALDAGRHPGEMLAFFDVQPGMKVAELIAGSGYTAELLARAVGPSGTVYGVNNRFILEKFAEKPWSERLAKPAMKNVVRVDRELDDPFAPELAGQLDRIFVVLVYHDFTWLGVDRDKMNAALFRALKPGGVLAVIDHSGRAGTGSTETKTLHRIEERIVREEIERAGFKLAAEGSFLRNPDDARDWNDAPTAAKERRGTSDRFVLKYVKP